MIDKTRQPIVSSSHLISEQSSELSELEYGLIIANHAFQRWTVRCTNACGISDLSPLDILILHNVNHRDREKKVATICFNLNIEDTHTASYSLRKLSKLGLVMSRKQGKETMFNTTKKGIDLCKAYRDVREECLIELLGTLGTDNEKIGEIARVLRSLSGLYDEAARAAASL
ncbi:MAG: winged helix DNA-binding protein [Gammaproteobacteria bacterium]|jgi:predicted MarR family transcription regulator|nr:winged helix DNA-binding protein [Gammaproteobacteria bacterium]MBT3723484.1 winged helix DNA-binding protein [Gammaproteobacteria bacterium]MBT4076574.1 winged helix DNA-binding protein [Gammaproteobacteria bacterium]MBT4194308.1 winged helix DNA-binding protein [Gammaproteobacteria bacterium]MBT4450862.1 winged helix DNA-binding protein [Gammaproteobacteria bacterium]